MLRLEKKPVPGYEDNYYLDPDNMEIINKKRGRPLKPQRDGAGYAEVQLWKGNVRTHKRLHRLFAEAYIPNPDNLPYINHKDKNPMNYSLDNLEWCDQSYNQKYGNANKERGAKISKALKGRSRPWVAGQKAKPIIAVDNIGGKTRYTSIKEAGRQLGIESSQISDVLHGRQNTCRGLRFYWD